MNWFATVKRYHNLGYYTVNDVNKFVVFGKITEAQAEEITGVPYTEPDMNA